MANIIEIKVFHISERLPSVRVPVLVFTETGSKYIAARFETNSKANNPSVNQIKWGLIYNNKIIGEVTAVTHWCPLNVGLSLPQPELQRQSEREIHTITA
jgi:hypothetical protein